MQLKQLFGDSYLAKDIGPADVLVTSGGTMYDKPAHKHTMSIDPSQFQEFFDACDKFYTKQIETRASYENYFLARGVDPEITDRALAFSRALQAFFPDSPNEDRAARKAYRKANPHIGVDQSFRDGMAVCSEISLLAQAYFQHSGLDSQFVAGEMVKSRELEFGERHAYLVIPQGGDAKHVIFDAARPFFQVPGLPMPRVSLIDVDLWNATCEQALRQGAFTEAREIMRVRTAFYGFGTGMNIWPEYFVDTKPERGGGRLSPKIAPPALSS